MEELRTFFTSPYTYLTFGAGALVGVWWTKLTAPTANLTLAAGVIALTIAAWLFFPRLVGTGQPIAIRLLSTVGVFCALSLAIYYTLWARQPDAKEARSPLVIEFMRLGAGRPHGNDKDAVVHLVLLVKNTGSAPTIATLWTLAITPLNQSTLTGLPRYILPTEPITLERADGQNADVYDPSDALYNKTATTPIQPGAAVSGILLFTFPDIDNESLHQKGTVYTVGCTDVNGEKVTTSYTIMGNDADAGFQCLFPWAQRKAKAYINARTNTKAQRRTEFEKVT